METSVNNKCKAFTSLEQSEKLVEILPLESADMHYPDYYFDGNAKGPCNTPYKEAIEDLFHVYINPKTKRLLPCWSLAALLATLPNEIITDDRFECHYQIDIRKYDGGDNTTLYQIAYGNNRGSSGSWHDMINTGEKESLIDCCVQMILKLNELNLL